MPILTRLLSPQAYGVASLAGTVISLVSVFALAGIDISYARAYYSPPPVGGANVERHCWRYALLASIVGSAIAAVFWWFFSTRLPGLDAYLAWVVAVGILVSVVYTMAQTRARLANEYPRISKSIVASGLISTATSIAIAAWWRKDATALLIPMILGYLLPILILGVPKIDHLLKPSKLSAEEGRALTKIGLAAVVTSPMFWLLSSSDRWFLQWYSGPDLVGVYSVGYSVAIFGMMVNAAVTAVWLPEASREYEADTIAAQTTLGRLMMRLIAAMALVWLFATAAGGDIIRWLADGRFHDAAQLVPFIAGGVFFYGASQLALYSLVLVNQFKWAALWWFLGGIFSLLLNRWLVPVYNGLGAAVTQCVSFAFISVGIIATSQRKYWLELDWVRLGVVLLVVLTAGLLLTPAWTTRPLPSLLLKLPVGLAVTLVVSRLAAPDWFGRVQAGVRKLFLVS